ncbi:MAG: hypothetical protein GC134_06395 [Proteobacteria bacterium]|nr:hypothetical protein [Pseudomonadota bacterium]
MAIRHLNSLDGRIETMQRRRRMAALVVFLSVLMWGALVLEYMDAQKTGATHHLTQYFILDVVVFQLALWLALVFRKVVGIALFVALLGFHVWMYEQTGIFPPKEAAIQGALELIQHKPLAESVQ